MKINHRILLVILAATLFSIQCRAQTDQEKIIQLRKASNKALKAHDTEAVLSYLTEDILTTTGNGTLLSGKQQLAEYISGATPSKMYWIRDTKEVVVNAERGLAWETGVWNGYNPDLSKGSIINGKYSAMWTNESGTWKIKSQLFVTLDEK